MPAQRAVLPDGIKTQAQENIRRVILPRDWELFSPSRLDGATARVGVGTIYHK
jgi:hypothetical protein